MGNQLVNLDLHGGKLLPAQHQRQTKAGKAVQKN
jgi:hypothetical protein